MAIGPLETFVFPGVFVKTNTEAAGASAAGNPRFPAIIGVGFEQIRVSDFEMIRGSSAIADNLILEEAVEGIAISSTDAGWIGGAQGTVNKFRVENFPIVTGDGTGTVATLPRNVIVTVNGEAVAVNAVNGLIGEVTLVDIPLETDVVRANYYFKRRDTFIENENLSFQADGNTATFKVRSSRIVKGNNGGQSATNADINATVEILYNPNPLVPGDEFERTVPVIQVKVNTIVATISALDGAHGTFTLSAIPAGGVPVTVSYFTNKWQDTYDILPAAEVTNLIKVGLSSDTSDFSIGQDCVLAGLNRLHWGTSYQISSGVYTAGSTPLINNVIASLVDTKVFGRIARPYQIAVDGNGDPITDLDGNYINLDGNKIFTLPSQPVDGTSTGEPTEDPANIRAYVGPDYATAYAAGRVTVTKINGSSITLEDSPSQGAEDKVYVTYFENLTLDDTWTITNEVPGGVGVGRYSVVSKYNGTALDVEINAGGTVTPVYPDGAILQTNPLTSSVEAITVTFDGVGGFTVTSTGKTGSAGTPYNKGELGRTYIDTVTGFRVTFAIDGFTPPVGTTFYKIGNPAEPLAHQTWFYTKTDSTEAVPGIRLTVATTSGGTQDNTGDTVLLQTFNKSGNEPNIGDSYYVTFDKEKTDYSVRYYTQMRDIFRDFGPLDITNKIVVGANLAFNNGARSVAIKQILKTAGQPDAPTQSYIEGVDAFDEPLPNGLRPCFIQPMTTDPVIVAYLATSNAIQSSIKYRNERTSVVGFSFGTTPETVIKQCKSLKSEKITAVYPDAAVISIPDAFGNNVQYLVDGSFLAVAIAGRDASPVTDIATPLTNQNIVGFDRLYRRLDDVTAALVANAGCTVLEEVTPNIRIRMYLTTDLSNALTRDPRIVEVKHFVQQGIRNNLDQFIGQKNLPSAIPLIIRAVSAYFSMLKNQNIIVDFKGIRVAQNPNEPSTVDVEAYYSPVFPLNWIIVTLNLRQSL